MHGIYKLENEMVGGSGKYDQLGIGSDRKVRESLDTSIQIFFSQ